MLTSKEIMSDEYQEKLRKAIWAEMCRKRWSYVLAAQAIKVSPVTLHKFVTQNRRVSRASFLKLLEWIQSFGNTI